MTPIEDRLSPEHVRRARERRRAGIRKTAVVFFVALAVLTSLFVGGCIVGWAYIPNLPLVILLTSVPLVSASASFAMLYRLAERKEKETDSVLGTRATEFIVYLFLVALINVVVLLGWWSLLKWAMQLVAG
jgi:nitrate reductase NapE component